MTLHRLLAQASMVVAMGALAFGCASGSESTEDLPPAPTDSGGDGSAGDTSIMPEDTGADAGGDVSTDTGPAGCKTNADCASDPAGKFCLPATDGGKSYCVPCLPAPFDECGPGTYCNDTTYTCEAGCKTTADCAPSSGDAGADGGDAADAGGGGSVVCDAVKHRCVGCIADPDCPAGFLCDRPSGACVPGCTMAKPCPTGKDCCSGSCKDTQKDISNCGTCGNTCTAPANATAGCNAGTCGIGMCNTGFGDCNSSATDGCETNTLTNKDNCGACGTVCSLANATAACTMGACTIGTCNGGYADCDVLTSTGCETRLNTVTDCGMCGRACTIPNGSGTCSTGTCAVAACNPGFGDCDGIVTNGCETNLAVGTAGPSGTVLNCGSCTTSCSVANGTASCTAGVCGVLSCSSPFANCNGSYSDGCETNTQISVSHCGGCTNACSTTGGTPSCSSGICSIACTPGFGNCDGLAANGCERNLTNDVNNCNSCGNVCSTPANASSSICKPTGPGGACAVGTCNSGSYDRDGVFGNGCECTEDSVGNTCTSALDLGTVSIGGTKTQIGNLVGAGDTDEDWYKITFPVTNSCSWTPSVSLTSTGTVAKMQVFTGCSGASGSGSFSCVEGISSSALLDAWEFTFPAGTCGDQLSRDPSPDNRGASLPFISVPTVIYVRVVRAGSFPGCYPYTLTIGN